MQIARQARVAGEAYVRTTPSARKEGNKMMQHDVFVSVPYGNENASLLNTIQSTVHTIGHDIFRSNNILADSLDFIFSFFFNKFDFDKVL